MKLDRYIRGCGGREPRQAVRMRNGGTVTHLDVVGAGASARLAISPAGHGTHLVRGGATLAALAVAIGRALPAEHRRAIIEHLGGRKKERGT